MIPPRKIRMFIQFNLRSLLIITILMSQNSLLSISFRPKFSLINHSFTFGNKLAPDWYQQIIREFTNYLNIPQDTDIKVRIIDASVADEVADAISTENGIWINEKSLEQQPKETRLWYLAHEVAHIKLNHSHETADLEQTARLKAALPAFIISGAYMCALHYSDIAQLPTMLKISLGTLLSFAGAIIATSQARMNFRHIDKHSKNQEMYADLTAAGMLCTHGMKDIVNFRITQLKRFVTESRELANDYNHPSNQETIAYLEAFLEEFDKQIAIEQNSVNQPILDSPDQFVK